MQGGGVRKIVDVFEEQVVIKRKCSAHSHRLKSYFHLLKTNDLHKLKPFSPVIGQSHNSFVGITSDPLDNLNQELFSEWLKRHQSNTALHFPTVDDMSGVEPFECGDVL